MQTTGSHTWRLFSEPTIRSTEDSRRRREVKSVTVEPGETFIVEPYPGSRHGHLITFRRLIDGYYANLGDGRGHFEEVK